MSSAILRPFFSYYGSKFRIAGRYPPPVTGHIIEPFAGSAAYACRYPHLNVTLVEANPIVAGVWDYLIRAPSSEILCLPLVGTETDIMALPVPQEAAYLIRYWCTRASAHPARKPTPWMAQYPEHQTQFWGVSARFRIAQQQRFIRHWSIVHGSYHDAPDVVADWFVDPPYQRAGHHYRRFGSKHMDYGVLANWCAARRGNVLVCENTGADWLPFTPFLTTAGTNGSRRTGRSAEVLWHRADDSAEVAAA